MAPAGIAHAPSLPKFQPTKLLGSLICAVVSPLGAGFATKLPSELYRFPKPGMTDEFVAKLLEAGILEEQKAKAQMRYGVTTVYMRPVQKLVNENNMNKQFRNALKGFLGR